MLSEQTQEFPDHLKDGREGDCYRAALASLIEVDIKDVPHFIELYPLNSSPDWFEASAAFVEEKIPGWTLRCIVPEYPSYVHTDTCPKRVIVSGQSPRGDWDHAILVDSITGEMVWDPHPDREGVLAHSYVIALTEK